MVGVEGLEPSQVLNLYAPEAYAYTNSATRPPFKRINLLATGFYVPVFTLVKTIRWLT